MAQVQVIRGLNLTGYASRRVESGSLSQLIGRLPGLNGYIDPDGRTGMAPPCLERVNGTANPSAPENIGGLIVKTPPGQNFGGKTVISSAPTAARGLVFPRFAATANMSMLIGMQPSNITHDSTPYDAGIAMVLDLIGGTPYRWLRFSTQGGFAVSTAHRDIYDSLNISVSTTAAAQQIVVSRLNVMLAVWSLERSVQEIYTDADGFTTPLVSGRYVSPKLTQDGTLEYGGYDPGYGTVQCSFKGYLMRACVTSTDLMLPANRGAALAVAQAMRAYYSGPTGTGT